MVELRLGEKSAGQFEDFIGTAQFLVLAFKGFDPFTFVGGHACSRTGIDFMLLHPGVERLGYAADLGGY